jgi:hypothetical protein
MSTIDELTSAIRSDLAGVEDMARWAYTDGWTPKGSNPETATSHTAPAPASGDDQVAGPKFDVGLGDQRARAAYSAAALELGVAHARLILAALDDGHTRQPAVQPWRQGDRPELGELLTAIEAMRVLLTLVETKAAKHNLGRARRHVDRAWRSLAGYLNRGAADPATQATDELCTICKIRPRVAKKGKRCETCAQWKNRNGYERPTKLDSTRDALDAQVRRLSRGEGHGDESFAGARGQHP